MLRSKNFVLHAVQFLDENQEEYEIGQTEDGTLLVTTDEGEAREILKTCIEAAPEVKWRLCKYCASGYSEEIGTYGKIIDNN